MFEAYKLHVYGLFHFFAAADQSSDEAVLSLESINMKEFTAFATDAGLVGSGKLSHINIRTIFAYVQQNMDLDSEAMFANGNNNSSSSSSSSSSNGAWANNGER